MEEKDTYKAMLTRDQRRFKEADRDHDGIATREEFTAFLHPEEFDHMRGLVVQVGQRRSSHLNRDIDFTVKRSENKYNRV